MIHYRIHPVPSTHHFEVVMSIPKAPADAIVSLPVWIPGSYMVREFARHLSQLKAHHGRKSLKVSALDKTTWQVHCKEGQDLTLRYRVYALDPSVRCAFLDNQRGFFNGTGLCLRLAEQAGQRHSVSFTGLPEGWQVATGMASLDAQDLPAGLADHAPDACHFVSDNYDELVDHPFELGPFWRGKFTARGVEHEFVVAGALKDFDGERLLKDTQTICEAQIDFWHPDGKDIPFQRYVFMLNAVANGYGGLEHRASTALIAKRKDLPCLGSKGQEWPSNEGYRVLLGLISHEYFHTWNVKRLRPIELKTIDYSKEVHSELLWFFEGFTSYYDDLFLARTGLLTESQYLQSLSKTYQAVESWPGQMVQSVAEASFDAWTKYYRQDENTPNATISYYNKGVLVALCLDMALRQNRSSLDHLMKKLWSDHQGGPISEADILAATTALGGASTAQSLSQWVHQRAPLPVAEALAAVGITSMERPLGGTAAWGLKLSESPTAGLSVQQVLEGHAASQWSLSAGDEILAIDGWRVRQTEELLRGLAAPGDHQVTVSRDGRLLQCSISAKSLKSCSIDRSLQRPERLAPATARRLKAWLQP